MSQRPTAHDTAVVAAATSAAPMIRFMRDPAYFLAASLSVVDEDEAPLGDVDEDALSGVPGDDIDDELDELPGVLAALPLADELELVSGVVLPDGVVLLLAEDEGVLLDDGVDVLDDDEVAGGFTVTLVDDDVDLSAGVSGALLQAASDSAESTASASIEDRFIRGLRVMEGGGCRAGLAPPSRHVPDKRRARPEASLSGALGTRCRKQPTVRALSARGAREKQRDAGPPAPR